MDTDAGGSVKSRFVVLDEENVPLRWFWTRAEAELFRLPGYTIRREEAPPQPGYDELMKELGESPF